MSQRLNALFVKRVTLPGKYHDEHGLILRVKPTGSKQWVQRLVVKGRRRDIGLGGYPLVSLAEARDAAFANRKLARAGGDPLALRRQPDIPDIRRCGGSRDRAPRGELEGQRPHRSDLGVVAPPLRFPPSGASAGIGHHRGRCHGGARRR